MSVRPFGGIVSLAGWVRPPPLQAAIPHLTRPSLKPLSPGENPHHALPSCAATIGASRLDRTTAKDGT